MINTSRSALPPAPGPATDVSANRAGSAAEPGSDLPLEDELHAEMDRPEASGAGDQSALPVVDGHLDGPTAAEPPTGALGADDDSACDRAPPPPLAAPGTAGPERWAGFREPLSPAPLWNPPGRKRVGLQAGHWLVEQAPEELRRLQHGTSGGGKQEWEVNLDLARRTRTLLEAAGIEVDVLPTTVPVRYRAHAFVSIHADGDPAGNASGFKVARPGFSSIPEHDDRLIGALHAAYGPATGLRRDDEHITVRMRYYYAFNSRRYCHAVAPGVPQAIVEAGFLTSASDRALLLGNPDAAARGIASGVLAFLNEGRRS